MGEEDEMPERMCILTREVKAPEAMIRFVRDPENRVVPDLKAKLPGRGVWVTARAGDVAEAVRRKLFQRGFRGEALVPGDLADQVAGLLRKQALQSLSLASKAGLVTAGHDKVDDWASKGNIRVLLEAHDGAPGGIEKLRRKALAVRPGKVEVVSAFSSAELGLALGRTNVIHAALAEGGMAEKFLGAAKKLQDYGMPGQAPGIAGSKENA